MTPPELLALRSPEAAQWKAALEAEDVIVDVRGDALHGLFEDAGFDCAVVGSGHIRLAGRLTYLRATRPA